MARFLFASIPIEGHSASPLSIMDRLLSTGHDVTWLAGAAYAGRAARLGVRHVPLDRGPICRASTIRSTPSRTCAVCVAPS